MIDEKKLIEEIDKYHDGLKPKYISRLVEAEILDIIDIIAEQPKVGEWIPCSERLPEKDGEYLVWYDCDYSTENPSEDDQRGYMIVYFDTDVGENGEFGCWRDIYDNYTLGFVDSEWIQCETVVAWCELPEPYKGD